MQQAQTQPATQPVQPKAPVAPASQTAPLPLDPNLLRHVGGGAATSSPNGNW
jgi:hypothetical protein